MLALRHSTDRRGYLGLGCAAESHEANMEAVEKRKNGVWEARRKPPVGHGQV